MEASTSTHLGYAAIAAFLAVATVFLYREKMKLDPPATRQRLAWRLSHFGSAGVFGVASAFFIVGGNPANDVEIAFALGVPLAIALLVTAAGFVLAFVRRGDNEV